MNDDMISVIEAGRQLERRKTTVFKIMKRLGIHPHKRRDSSRGNQVTAFITNAEFLRVKEELLSAPAAPDDEEDAGDGFVSAEVGVFYLIQLEPELDPLRLKVGFAANMNERLRHLRCSAPFATVIKSWPCRRLWEKTAIDCVTSGCERLHTEVFRCASLEAVASTCDQFFGLMPSVVTDSASLPTS
jgi:hypothetical protein